MPYCLQTVLHKFDEMKRTSLILVFAALLFFIECEPPLSNHWQTVNSIIGDVSFFDKYGHLPDRSTSNELRVRAHLEYVENLLRKKDPHKPSDNVKVRRHHLLTCFTIIGRPDYFRKIMIIPVSENHVLLTKTIQSALWVI